MIAGVLTAIGMLGLATIIGGALAALRRVRSPVPMVLVASGTTIAVGAGMLLAPVMMASLGLGEANPRQARRLAHPPLSLSGGNGGRVSHVFCHAAVPPLCPAKITQVVNAAEMPMIATDSTTA